MKKDNLVEFHICSENKFNQNDLFIINGSISLNIKNKIINQNRTELKLSLKVTIKK